MYIKQPKLILLFKKNIVQIWQKLVDEEVVKVKDMVTPTIQKLCQVVE